MQVMRQLYPTQMKLCLLMGAHLLLSDLVPLVHTIKAIKGPSQTQHRCHQTKKEARRLGGLYLFKH